MIFGYARVSTKDQNLDLQIDALKTFGVDEIHEEKISSREKKRQVLDNLILNMREGDTLVVYKLDRLGRTVTQLIDLVESFTDRGINFVSLSEQLNTTTPIGKFVFHVLCAMAQMERDILSERTKAALAAAKLRGRSGGRPTIDKNTVKNALKLYKSKEYSIDDILKMTGISKGTLYKYIKLQEGGEPPYGRGQD